MIPSKSKKNLEATIEEIRKFSFSYLEKYAPSRQQLRTYLLKKFFKSTISYVTKSELLILIDLVISDLEKNKFISDKFYSQSKTKKFLKKGYSINKIRNYLINKGINEKYIKDSISKINLEETDQDFFSAIKTCKKRRIGPNREEDNRILFYKKDMSILARSGFNYETSKKVLDLSKKDYEKLFRLL
jgi:regulatory protein